MPNATIIESDPYEAPSLYERDQCARAHGISVEEVGPGYSRVAMLVREDMVSGYAICHGGVTFMLADTAATYAACTSDHIVLGLQAEISWMAPVQLGDVLTAECRRAFEKDRAVVYDVMVTNQTGATVALFRVHGRRVQVSRATASN